MRPPSPGTGSSDDMSYIAGDKADIASALSPAMYDMNSSDPVPGEGGRKPSPTSRKLQYGITGQPSSDMPIPALLPSESPEPYMAPEILDPTVDDLLSAPEDPEVAGIAANDPLANL